VAEGSRLSKTAPLDRWAVGDLAVEAVPAAETRADRSTAQRRLESFSSETNLPLGLLKDCRRTSLAWPLGTRIADVSHARHSKVAGKPNKLRHLLGDELSEGMTSRLRERIEKAEDLLSDAEVRSAVIERSKARKRYIVAAARALDDEELAKARAHAKIMEQDAKARLLAPQMLAQMAERAIRGNVVLAKMVADLLDLRTVADQLPAEYHDRTAQHLEQVHRAAQQALTVLRPATRSPQPCDVIVVMTNDQTGVEHR